MKEDKVKKYLKICQMCVSLGELKEFIKDNGEDCDLFTGWQCLGLEFNKSTTGRKYIQKIVAPRCYLD